MNEDINLAARSRVINAFFDTEDAAKTAVGNLVAAGIPSRQIMQNGGDVTVDATDKHEKGFWESLKDLFLPADDRYTYAEGLRRGGYLVSVQANEVDYDRVLDILDDEGAVDLDAREGQWRSEGWSGYIGEGLAASAASGLTSAPAATTTTAYSTGTTAPAAGVERSASVSRPALAQDEEVIPLYDEQRPVGIRDVDHGRVRLRSYRLDTPASGQINLPDESVKSGFNIGTKLPAEPDASLIVEHMEVMSADGQMVGTVDHLDGPDRIKLAKTTSPDGQHHFVPLTWIDHIDQHVHLKKTLAEVTAGY